MLHHLVVVVVVVDDDEIISIIHGNWLSFAGLPSNEPAKEAT
jgi:hypothetical protein